MKVAKAKDNDPSPFERFKKFTKELLAVPREELQTKLAKYEKQKGKRKRRS